MRPWLPLAAALPLLAVLTGAACWYGALARRGPGPRAYRETISFCQAIQRGQVDEATERLPPESSRAGVRPTFALRIDRRTGHDFAVRHLRVLGEGVWEAQVYWFVPGTESALEDHLEWQSDAEEFYLLSWASGR